uniref:Ig-like domain-containing protein n=1 Tax=Mesocestoides corti TaxID=53468 RepID=A0A5K3EI52_MESCO
MKGRTTDLPIVAVALVLFIPKTFGYDEALPGDDYITGVFLDEHLFPEVREPVSRMIINITVEEEENEVTLHCDDGQRRAVWLKNGLSIETSLKTRILSTGSLRISNVLKNHSGIYQCFTKAQDKMILVRSYLLQVAYKPVALRHFAKSVYLTAGQSGHIICCLSGFPEIEQVMWHRTALPGATVISVDENITIVQSISGRPFPIKELVQSLHPGNNAVCYKKPIPHAFPEMSGSFTCQGKNALGWGLRSTPFSVFVKVFPYFTQRPENYAGRNMTFSEIAGNCQARGFPPPVITWMKYVLKAVKHVRKNNSASSEMTKHDSLSLFCPSESRTMCWTAEKQDIVSHKRYQTGIFACTASNDLGDQTTLIQLGHPGFSTDAEYAFGIEILDPIPCGLQISVEVFTWAPTVIPQKAIFKNDECVFFAEYSTSPRDKQWRRENISVESVNSGQFTIFGHSSNALIALKAGMNCVSKRAATSNTIYGWTSDSKCTLTNSLLDRAAISDKSLSTDGNDVQDYVVPVRVIFACGSLLFSLVSILACFMIGKMVPRKCLLVSFCRGNRLTPHQGIQLHQGAASVTSSSVVDATAATEVTRDIRVMVQPAGETRSAELDTKGLIETQTETKKKIQFSDFKILEKPLVKHQFMFPHEEFYLLSKKALNADCYGLLGTTAQLNPNQRG